MGSVLHFILLFSGLWTPAMCVARQFYVVEERKNWTEAQKYCRGIYTDLATIENQEDMDTVVALVNKSCGSEKTSCYWIGMNQKADQNNNTNWVWSDGSNFTYSYWGPGQPNNAGTDNCVELHNVLNDKWVEACWVDAFWNDLGCSYTRPFICYKKINLILVQQQMTWREALRFCRENYVDLVSVHTNETQDSH